MRDRSSQLRRRSLWPSKPKPYRRRCPPWRGRGGLGGAHSQVTPHHFCFSMVAFCYYWWHTGVMPTISLRLTEREHADLKRWAHDSHRSIQKEAIYRLFTEPEYDRAVTDYMKQEENQPTPGLAEREHSEPDRALRGASAPELLTDPDDSRSASPVTDSGKSAVDRDWLMRRAGKKK